MTAAFVAVYETVIDNAVEWRCVKENRLWVSRGSAEYETTLRETMISLTTKPASGDGGNMIERCIQVGAADMLANTQHRERLLVRRVRYDTIRDAILTCARKPT